VRMTQDLPEKLELGFICRGTRIQQNGESRHESELQNVAQRATYSKIV
jgi:hypothetical protein